jgi:hypothetical protein
VEDAGCVLDLLARAHLIQTAGAGRFGMHDLLRAYACGLAAAHDTQEERRAALTRVFDHYLHTAATAIDILYPVGLDYWITPGRASRLGSWLSDHFGRLPACSLSDGLPDSAVPGQLSKDAGLLMLRHENAVLRRQIGRARCQPAGCGLRRCRDWFPAADGARCSR